MKFVFFGYDFMLPVVHRLLDDGHELVGIMSFECDNVFNFNQECRALAQSKNIPVILSPATDIHIESLIAKGADVFFSAGYPFKIPPIDETKAYGLNMHPSYLPRARGLMPVPHILMTEDKDAAGITVHKLTQEFDEGDIILQKRIDLTPHESIESYCAKTLLLAPEMASEIFKDIENFWKEAMPQQQIESYDAPSPTDKTRTLNWNARVCELTRLGRAFGRFGCLANIGGALYSVMQFDGWEEPHNHAPGTCVILQPKITLIAVVNGYICLQDFHRLNPA